MQLNTLGTLEVEGTSFSRAKPLLLLAYLAIEGSKSRVHLAELMWPDSVDPRDSLSTTVRRLRAVGPEHVEATETHLRARLKCDAVDLEAAARAGSYSDVVALYRGPFLDGIELRLPVELEEWVYATRERLALLARRSFLNLAEAAVQDGDPGRAKELAERAFTLQHGPAWEETPLVRLMSLLQRTGSPRVREARLEAEGLGIDVDDTNSETRDSPAPLPRLATSFHGRHAELEAIAGLFAGSRSRLVTLHGGGGVGKTRLASESAHANVAAGLFPDGAVFVQLEEAHTPEQAVAAVASALSLSSLAGVDAEQQVIRAVGAKRMLLVLDNFEQLVEVSALPSSMIRQCPNVRLLVTTRRTLNVPAEHIVTIGGLPVGSDPRGSDALSLLMSRMAKNSTLALGEDQLLSAGRRVCQLVDGNPLAIELAAASARVVPLHAIANELETNLDLLQSRDRTAPPRHKSVRAALQVSWDLLSDTEKHAMSSLAVFNGGFDREAADHVAGVDLTMLGALADAAQIRLHDDDRFRLHPQVTQFTLQKLNETPDRGTTLRRAHAQHYLTKVAAAGFQVLSGDSSNNALDWLEREAHNIAHAWRFGAEGADAVLLREAAWTLAHYGEMRSRYQEVISLFDHAEVRLASSEGDEVTRTTLGWIRGCNSFLLFRVGNIGRAISEGNRAVEVLKHDQSASGNSGSSGLWSAYQGLAMSHLSTSDFTQAVAYLRAAIEVTEADLGRSADADDLPVLRRAADVSAGICLQTYAYIDVHKGEFQGALAWLRAATIRLEPHRAPHLAYVYWMFGQAYTGTGALKQASWWLHRALSFARDVGFRTMESHALNDLARVQLRLGDHEAARATCEDALPAARKSGDMWLKTSLLAALGMAAKAASRHEAAQGHFRESLLLAQEFSGHRYAMEALLGLTEYALQEGRQEQATSLLVFLAGSALSPSHVAKRAAQLLGQISEAALGRASQPGAAPARMHAAETELERVFAMVL